MVTVLRQNGAPKMETNNFIKCLLDHGLTISNRNGLGWPWTVYYEYAKLTALINYECNFDENGVCKQRSPYVRRDSKNVSASNSCCCGDCSFKIGYLKSITNNMATIKKIATLFDGRTGFWRKGVGCILPRQYRSTTCLTHKCYNSAIQLTPSEILLKMLITPWEPRRTYNYVDWYTPKSLTIFINNKAIKIEWVEFHLLKRMLLREKNGTENIKIPIIKENDLTGHSKYKPQ